MNLESIGLPLSKALTSSVEFKLQHYKEQDKRQHKTYVSNIPELGA